MSDNKSIEKRRENSIQQYGNNIFHCSYRLIDYCLAKKININ